jgi:probable rRNA maturation factor
MKPPPADVNPVLETDLAETAPEEPEPSGPAVDILIGSDAWRGLPEAEDVARQAIAAAAASDAAIDLRETEVSVLFCDDGTIAALNGRWRGQEKPTNVLSFPAQPPPPGPPPQGREGAVQEKAPLGDIAIAYETLVREAGEGGKTASAHLAHLVVHGFLHLAGYDHETDDEAEEMERLEREILARIGVADPYAARDADI